METTEKNVKKRPGWVWAISIFYFISAVFTLFSFYLIFSGKISIEPAQKAYFDSLTPLDHGITIILGFFNLTGAVTLFLLRRQALYFFTGSFAVNILMTVWHSLSKGWVAAIGGPGLVGVIIAWGLLIAVCLYSRRLIKAGVLT